MIIGYLDLFKGNQIFGWLGSFADRIQPFITANGKPCRIIATTLPRPDVAQATGLEPEVGYAAEVPHLEYGAIEFKLYALTETGKRKLIDSKTFTGAVLQPGRLCSVFDALEIARQPNAVAITCWDGTHNPIGRAQVLYNIVKQRRPAVIFAFDLGVFGQGLWQPLINSDIKVVLIPWDEREVYFELFRNVGLCFDSIWICKPCYPSFELAKHLAHSASCFIQDIDDNEAALAKADELKNLPCGWLSHLMSRPLLAQIPQRSVASISLQAAFGGQLVRHARAKKITQRSRQTNLKQEIRIGFIGTARPHKGVVEAARAISYVNKSRGFKLKFVVGGIYDPASIREQLLQLGCEVHDVIDASSLNAHLENLDVVISGFPEARANREITHYQISSKIGDALANARPVLVPAGPAVADLFEVKGIYLFNSDNFVEQLLAAISYNKKIELPEAFSLAANYQVFQALEREAQKTGASTASLFPGFLPTSRNQAEPAGKNILLVWKQHDAGLYGRRVDQLARHLATDPNLRVTLLEIITPEQLASYAQSKDRVDSDRQFIYRDYFAKQQGMVQDGVHYHSLCIQQADTFATLFNRFLIEQKLYPSNTLGILFPAITEYAQLLKALDGYQCVCDFVDNQTSWEAANPVPLLQQYAAFSQFAQACVFNSAVNQAFFVEGGICTNPTTALIPNWYALPASTKLPKPQTGKASFNIIYSGNMNDRIDWSLLLSLQEQLGENVRIHLVGTAERAQDELTQLLTQGDKFVYHGPMRERDLIAFASQCDLAIMPHTLDQHSLYMNPLKLKMYAALELACITSKIPGIDSNHAQLKICESHREFISAVQGFIQQPIQVTPEAESEDFAQRYSLFIQPLLANLKAEQTSTHTN